MGKYDNYNNAKNIATAQKVLDKLTKKKKPNLYKIDIAKKNLETAKLFESCQIFGREDFWKSLHDPNADVMFSDDNEVVFFFDRVINYKDIVSYRFVENKTQKATTTTKKTGTVSRAIVGGALFGGVGALVGASSAGSKSETTFYETADGFTLQIFLKDGRGIQCSVPNAGFLSNKISNSWWELGMKLQTIIDSYQSEE